MAQPQPGTGQPYVARSPWFVFRVLCLVAAVCLFIAALEFSAILHGGTGLAWAWAAGGVSAFFLAWAVP